MHAEEKYKITIVTATFNSAKTLEQTITSIVAQDYPNIEYIIVDGSSVDGTLDIIKKYEGMIDLRWISEPDAGIYDAFNKGIDMATGDYIHFLGSDDSMCNAHTISSVVKQLENDTDILSAPIKVIDEKSGREYLGCNQYYMDKANYHGGMIPHPGMFVKTSLMEKYKFDTSYKIAADYKFFLQCYYDDSIHFKYISEPVVFFAKSGSSSVLSKCWEENNRLYSELGLPFHAPSLDGPFLFECLVRKILWRLGVLAPALQLADFVIRGVKSRFIWQKHTCDNPVCRWCGRM